MRDLVGKVPEWHFSKRKGIAEIFLVIRDSAQVSYRAGRFQVIDRLEKRIIGALQGERVCAKPVQEKKGIAEVNENLPGEALRIRFVRAYQRYRTVVTPPIVNGRAPGIVSFMPACCVAKLMFDGRDDWSQAVWREERRPQQGIQPAGCRQKKSLTSRFRRGRRQRSLIVFAGEQQEHIACESGAGGAGRHVLQSSQNSRCGTRHFD